MEDIEIARNTKLDKIIDIANSIGIKEDAIEQYGKYKAKISLDVCKHLKENKNASLLIITHYPRILEYLHPDFVHILSDGKIVKTGDIELARQIEKNGYSSVNVMIGNDNDE